LNFETEKNYQNAHAVRWIFSQKMRDKFRGHGHIGLLLYYPLLN